jgi:ElaB/YqjD/DUF883 family membrane-anchored ribosome-binding protein
MNDIITKQKLRNDWRALVKDLEIVLGEVKMDLSDKATAVRARLEKNLEAARDRLAEIEDEIKDQAADAAQAADDYVHENPWQSAGIALGVGFILGVLISRSTR